MKSEIFIQGLKRDDVEMIREPRNGPQVQRVLGRGEHRDPPVGPGESVTGIPPDRRSVPVPLRTRRLLT